MIWMFLVIHNCSFSVTFYWKELHVHLHSGTLEVQNATVLQHSLLSTDFLKIVSEQEMSSPRERAKSWTFPMRETQVLSHHHFSDWCHWWCLDLFGFTLSEANTLGHMAHCGLRSLPIIVLVKSRGYSLVLVEVHEQRPRHKSCTFRSVFHVMDGDLKWCRWDGLKV